MKRTLTETGHIHPSIPRAAVVGHDFAKTATNGSGHAVSIAMDSQG